jgi:uncharacterized protein YdeI (BOF family)
MNAKLIVVLTATFIAAPAFAGQEFGRDSVYATHSAPTSQPLAGASVARFGRDSIYATQTVSPKQEVKVGTVTYKFGRA